MSMTFTKLFSSITESTIWVEPHATRIVWITMLAMADRKGRVWGSIPGLANRARVTLEECEAAIACFMRPDKYSRTKEHNGRRIEEIDGGWQLLNYAKFRAIQDEEQRRESKREWDRENRGKGAAEVNPSGLSESDVDRHQPSQAEEEAEEEPSSNHSLKRSTSVARGTRLPPDWEPDDDLQAWTKAEQPSWTPTHADKILASFKDYWTAKAGASGVKLDWDATWRNWVRKEVPMPEPRKPKAAPVYAMSDADLERHARALGVATAGLRREEVIAKCQSREAHP